MSDEQSAPHDQRPSERELPRRQKPDMQNPDERELPRRQKPDTQNPDERELPRRQKPDTQNPYERGAPCSQRPDTQNPDTIIPSYLTRPPFDNQSISPARTRDGEPVRAEDGKYYIDATGNGSVCSMAGISTRISQAPQPLSLCFELIGVDTSTPLLRNSIHHTGKEGAHSINTEIHNYLDSLYSKQKAPMFGGPWFNTMLSGDRLAVNITRNGSSSLNAKD